MSYGWRCPYYYAIAGWIVWLGCRGIARITLINVTAVSQNDLLMLAAVFTMIVISTQVAFVNFLNVRKFEAVPEEELTHQQKTVQTSPVVKVLGLDDHHESLADVRQATMRHNAEEVGKQFLLSEREVGGTFALRARLDAKTRSRGAVHQPGNRTCAHQAHLRENRPALTPGNPRLHGKVHILRLQTPRDTILDASRRPIQDCVPWRRPEPKTISPKSSQSEGGTERVPRRATGQQEGRLAIVHRHAANRPRSKTLTSYLYSSISALKAGMERLMTSADTQ